MWTGAGFVRKCDRRPLSTLVIRETMRLDVKLGAVVSFVANTSAKLFVRGKDIGQEVGVLTVEYRSELLKNARLNSKSK